MDDDPTGDILKKISAIRNTLPVTSFEIAARMGTSHDCVRSLEHRMRYGRGIQLSSFIRYCRAIGVRLHYEVLGLSHNTDTVHTQHYGGVTNGRHHH